MRSTPRQVLPESIGVLGSTSRGTSVTSGSPAGTFGAWTQIIASTSYDAIGLFIGGYCPSNSGIVKVGVGASGSEQAVASCVVPTAGEGRSIQLVPVVIPAGSRVSFSVAAGASSDCRLHATLARGPSTNPLIGSSTVYGFTNGSTWVRLDAGGTANTKGAYGELAASTSRDARGFTLYFSIVGNTLGGSTYGLVDLAIGAAGSEIIIAADIPYWARGFAQFSLPSVIGPVWTPIPAGSRLAARSQSSDATAGNRVLDCCIVLWE